MIFYFSGTGNSQYVAQRISAATKDNLIAISAAIKDGEYSFSGQTAGFVFPVYFYGIPNIVKQFISRLELNCTYAYCVLTCGGTTGNTAGQLAALLDKRGINLDASFAVTMVDNYIPLFHIPSPQQAAAQLEKAEPHIDEICKSIADMARGDMNRRKGPMPRLTSALLYPLYEKARKTHKFHVTDKCNGCGLCWRICPEEAIKITDDKPRWVNAKCSKCFGCLHRCPVSAIQYASSSSKKHRYVNPKSDFIR